MATSIIGIANLARLTGLPDLPVVLAARIDTILDAFDLNGTLLDRLAQLIRGAGTACAGLAPESAGLLAASLGLSRMYRGDLAQSDTGLALYGASYRWCRDACGESHNRPVKPS